MFQMELFMIWFLKNTIQMKKVNDAEWKIVQKGS
jgi:hypothetical protein